MHKSLIEQQGFKLLEQIDSTLHTEKWKATQLELDRLVCLQLLKPAAACNALEREHFLLIARTFAKVKSEAIAAVFDIVSTADLHYVVMEYVDGPTIGSLVEAGHRLAEPQILKIASSLANCIDQLWQKDRIIHRNLKGESVHLDPRGVAKLTDFSLAVTASQDLAALDNGHIVGTPSFIAPEYAQGSKTLNTQTDMYSFGALLYQLATGQPPFAALSPDVALSSQVRAQIPPPHQVNPDISVEFSWFLHRLMMKNPVNRYPDWNEVIQDIHRVMKGEVPAGIQIEERFLSTIDSKPLLEFLNEGEEEADEATDEEAPEEEAPSVRLRPKKQTTSQFEHDHRRDIFQSNIRLALLMTLLMLAWFAGLAWYRGVYEPEQKRISESQKPRPQEVVVPPPAVVFNVKTNEPKQVVKVEPAPQEIRVNPPHEKRPDLPRRDRPVVQTPPTRQDPETPETPEVVKPVAREPMSDEVKQALARAAKAGDLEAMRAAVSDDDKPFLGREVIKGILHKAPTGNQLLERTMDSKKDQPISFNWRGKSRIVVPREVTENSVTLEANGRRQEIKFSDLTPDEMLSLINKPDSPAEALTYSLLLMKTKQKSDVPFYASKCLPLQDVLLEAMKE